MKKMNRVILLLRKYIYNELSPKEDEELQEWASSDKVYEDYISNLKSNLSKEYANYEQLDNQELIQAQHRMLSIIKTRTEPQRRYFKWNYFLAAASIVIAVSFSIYIGVNFKEKPVSNKVSNVVKPGKNNAFLRTEDGNQIDLGESYGGITTKDGEISYTEADKSLLKLGKVQNLEIVIPLGAQYQVILPDNSKVWLNAGSSLKYPSTFENTSLRTVQLSGEAYFEVTKDKNKPFIVLSNDQKIQVTGTSFNVFAYPEEHMTKTTLVEGQVYVYKALKGKENSAYRPIKLSPNEESVNGQDHWNKYPVDIAMATAWKEGDFYFKNTPVDVLMRQIARWYNVKVVYKTTVPKELFTGEMSRKVDLFVVMDFLKGSGIKVSLKEDTLFVE